MAQGSQEPADSREALVLSVLGEGNLADVEAGQSGDGGWGQETQSSSGSCKGVPLLPQPPSPQFK